MTLSTLLLAASPFVASPPQEVSYEVLLDSATGSAIELVNPLHVAAPDGDEQRLFVLEGGSPTSTSAPTGQIRIIRNGALLAAPFLVVPGAPLTNAGGLTGLAFHPDYAANGRFFVLYSTDVAGAPGFRLSEFSRNPFNPDLAFDTENVLLEEASPIGSAHLAGRLAFGPEEDTAGGRRMLLVSIGDGGVTVGGNGTANTLNNYYGKLLRLDVDSPTLVPPTPNPFASASGGATGPKSLTLSLGLRNPYGFSVDRVNGSLWIGDVGSTRLCNGPVQVRGFEEVNSVSYGQALYGLDFGWPCIEGITPMPLSGPCFGNDNIITAPVMFENSQPGRALIGGNVMRQSAFSNVDGEYFYGFSVGIPDSQCSGASGPAPYMRSYNLATGMVTNRTGDPTANPQVPGVLTAVVNAGYTSIDNVFGFGEGADGALYACVNATGPGVGLLVRLTSNFAVNTVCDPNAPVNSVGQFAEMYAYGSQVVSDNNVTLGSRNMPSNIFGIFLVSANLAGGPIALPNTLGSLCISPTPVGRYAMPGQIQGTGSGSSIELGIDLTAVPQSSTTVPVMAGETWHFQCWYRDIVGGSPISNISDALSLSFQ